jgi:tetratricopeptide (TPR) repeat protein
MIHRTILIISLIFFFQSCSLDKFVIRQTGTLLDYGVLALYEESDLILAEQALASNIKLLEGMVKGDPENKHLLLLTSQALAGYAMGFVEDESPQRAKVFYLRAREYGLRVLRENSRFMESEYKPLEDFTKAVYLFNRDDLDALFWTAFAWAGWINLSLDDPQAYVELPKVQVMMQHILDLDESYFFASAHLFFGSVLGTKPKMLGGDPDKAKEHFEKSIKITGGKFLLAYIYYIKYYALKTFNEELFDQLLAYIKETPVNALPEFQLLNSMAKEKATKLEQNRDEWF